MLGEILTAIVTPFKRDGAVDLQAFRALAAHLVDNGSDGLVVTGTTGESPTLSDDERFALYDAAVDEVGDRATVIAGTGTYSTAHSVHLTARAHELGVHGFLVVTPYYSKPPVRGIVRHFEEIAAVTDLPIWVSECGASSFGAEEVQEFGLTRTAELLIGRAPRIHWYSLFDLPQAWPATTRHREAEGSSYYRHFYMGLVGEGGTPKRAASLFPDYTPDLGICQWFHFEDHRLDDAVLWLKRLGVRYLRTGLSWADSFRPNAEAWFDRMIRALDPFEVTVTFCFTPEERGLAPHHTSPPLVDEEFAEFCARMLRRYWRAGAAYAPLTVAAGE